MHTGCMGQISPRIKIGLSLLSFCIYFILYSPSDTENVNPVEYSDNPVATSEDDTTSVTFSEDGFLEELEDLQYTPSPDSDRVRTG